MSDVIKYQCCDILNFNKFFASVTSELNLYENEQITAMVDIVNKAEMKVKINIEKLIEEWIMVKKFIVTNVPKNSQAQDIRIMIYRHSRVNELKNLIDFFNTLPLVTVSVERGFSVMNHIKNECRSKILDDLLCALMKITIHGPEISLISNEFLEESIEHWKNGKNRLFI